VQSASSFSSSDWVAHRGRDGSATASTFLLAGFYGDFRSRGRDNVRRLARDRAGRPAFLFYIRRSAEIEGTLPEGAEAGAVRHIAVQRVSTVAVAATSADAVPIEAGLGSWS
jgi:hypothetical protein